MSVKRLRVFVAAVCFVFGALGSAALSSITPPPVEPAEFDPLVRDTAAQCLELLQQEGGPFPTFANCGACCQERLPIRFPPSTQQRELAECAARCSGTYY